MENPDPPKPQAPIVPPGQLVPAGLLVPANPPKPTPAEQVPE